MIFFRSSLLSKFKAVRTPLDLWLKASIKFPHRDLGQFYLIKEPFPPSVLGSGFRAGMDIQPKKKLQLLLKYLKRVTEAFMLGFASVGNVDVVGLIRGT